MINMVVDGDTNLDRGRNILLNTKFKENIKVNKDFKNKKIKYLKKCIHNNG